MNIPTAIRILIVEDDALFADVVKTLVEPIMKAFPGSIVSVVKTVEAMLAAVNDVPAPDITILDLTLPPSGMEETLAHLDALEARTAVVIVTGHTTEAVRAIIGARPTPIVEKRVDFLSMLPFLNRAICAAVDAYQKRTCARMRSNIEIMRRVTADPEHHHLPDHARTQ